jgi:hypothetical protein
VRISLLVLVSVQLCQCASDSALVRYHVTKGYPILSRVRAFGGSQAVTSLAHYICVSVVLSALDRAGVDYNYNHSITDFDHFFS